MRKLIPISLSLAALFLCSNQLSAVITINVASGDGLVINSVTYSSTGLQSSPATSAIAITTAVNVVGIQVDDGGPTNLNFYNTGNAAIVNSNFAANTGTTNANGGVGVYDVGSKIRIQDDGLAAYEAAVANAATNTNLMNYLFYDGSLQNMPNATTADFDLLYQYAWTTEDYLVVAERNGNTFFELTPLGADGNPIAGANNLLFDSAYGWRSGFENDFDPNNGQDMWFSVAKIDKFFEDTLVPEINQLVYGYRVDNDGNADVKFFGASNDPFTNNPQNPNPLVPEPSTYAFILGLIALGSTACKRRV